MKLLEKRKIDSSIFNRLKCDPDENVRLSLLHNTKISIEQKQEIDSEGSRWYQREVFQKLKQSTSTDKEIELFGYNDYWISLGIINKKQIQVDLFEFKKGNDSNPDVFRHKRLKSWLNNKQKVDQQEIDDICKLFKEDIDISFANYALSEFFCSDMLNDNQRLTLESKIENFSPILNSLIKKHRIQRKKLTNL